MTVLSSFAMSNQFDVLADDVTKLVGWDFVAYAMFDDAPEEKGFDWGKLLVNVLAGLVVAAAVAAVVALSVLAFPAVIAIATGAAIATSTLVVAGVIGGLTFTAGAVATFAMANDDIKSGEVSDIDWYKQHSYNVSATTGGILQTFYGLYDISKLIANLPSMAKNAGNAIARFMDGIDGGGGGNLAFAGGGSIGSAFAIEDAIALGLSAEEILALLTTGSFNAIAGNMLFDSGGGESTGKLVGTKGTQTNSTTTWKKGKKERIDVENPAPNKRDGQIHYHTPSNKKWYYDIKNNTFYDPKTKELAPKSIQRLLDNDKFMNGIKQGLKILGE